MALKRMKEVARDWKPSQQPSGCARVVVFNLSKKAPAGDVEKALRKLFKSCGEVLKVSHGKKAAGADGTEEGSGYAHVEVGGRCSGFSGGVAPPCPVLPVPAVAC